MIYIYQQGIVSSSPPKFALYNMLNGNGVEDVITLWTMDSFVAYEADDQQIKWGNQYIMQRSGIEFISGTYRSMRFIVWLYEIILYAEVIHLTLFVHWLG